MSLMSEGPQGIWRHLHYTRLSKVTAGGKGLDLSRRSLSWGRVEERLQMERSHGSELKHNWLYMNDEA